MNSSRGLFAFIAIVFVLLGVRQNGVGGQDKKPILSDEQFTTFVAADAKFLSEALGKDKIDKKAGRKIQAVAAMIAAYAHASNHAESSSAANHASEVLDRAGSGDWKGAKEHAAFLYPKVVKESKDRKVEFKSDVLPLMFFFSSEKVGGFGVEQELGDYEDVKGKITDAQFARLNELGYKIAVVGKEAERFAPAKDMGAATRKNWLAFAAELRESSLSLATAAAAKKEGDAKAALKRIDTACTNCHDVFK